MTTWRSCDGWSQLLPFAPSRAGSWLAAGKLGPPTSDARLILCKVVTLDWFLQFRHLFLRFLARKLFQFWISTFKGRNNPAAMPHLANPLATAEQLYRRGSFNAPPSDLQDAIFFSAQVLTQAAGLLLELPQCVTARSNVILARYWLIDSPLAHEFSVSVLKPVCSVHRAS